MTKRLPAEAYPDVPREVFHGRIPMTDVQMALVDDLRSQGLPALARWAIRRFDAGWTICEVHKELSRASDVCKKYSDRNKG